jgi:hypothetical protein
MHIQLQGITGELREAGARVERFADLLTDEEWHRRPDVGRWSAAECIAHLNLTSQAFLPPLRVALERGRTMGLPAPKRYRRDPLGWFLWRSMAPPVRVRVRTAAAFVPEAALSREETLGEFARLQDNLIDLVASSDALPLQKLRIRSPFDARVSYNVFAAFGILARHQHRHLWQAEQVTGNPR